ncbi:DUF2089 family protein [Avrilella dinanensis]|uniref:DUF2089 domain-containing protein n=1 Tax=Avrilella dinanensis TaxID=2008672 RepID=A0A2M9R4M7_9FLAO|nr:DUF2089 family protein [Avrilella dinanensis]PJR03814.1 hypothetical protein CDL10_04205 [Avrilella dinanensis]
MNLKIPNTCPSCESRLKVSELVCDECQTKVSGNFPLPVFMQLSPKEQEFVLQFFLHSGSLKEMAKQIGVSYPTLRNQLDDMIEKTIQLKKQYDDENNSAPTQPV